MNIRLITTTAATAMIVISALTACGAPQQTATEATPTVAPEEQIRQMLTEVVAAQSAGDTTKIAELTCAEFRDEAASNSAAMTDATEVPPMEAMPVDVFAAMAPAELADALGKEYTGASDEALLALAESFVNRDEIAYQSAMAEVMAQSMEIKLEDVANIVVDGDDATADVQMSLSTGGKVNYDLPTMPVTLVREDGTWKDCTPPDEEA
jgi:frataxin-like iron-binding protein CyaY